MKNVKDLKTTIFGILMILMFTLQQFGVLTPDQAEGVDAGIKSLFELFADGFSLYDVAEGLPIISAVLLLFVKDPKKKDFKKDSK
jgi:hypothetical protein